jgi:ligand-binding sensor domain-containing protein
MIRFSIPFILILSFAIGSKAQQAFTVFNATNSPLPENSVRCVASAPNGLKWIGTDYGLASYDGTNWNIYNTFNSSIPDNSIRSLAVDSNYIWVGTFNGGLGRFDGSNWTTYNTSNSQLPDDFVRSLSKDSTGNLWVGTIGGLGVFDGIGWTIYNQSNTPLQSINISALHHNANSTFVGTINGGMGIFTNSNWQHFTIANSNIPDNSILSITEDNVGTPWIATPANGISAYIGGIQFLTFSTLSSGIASNSTTSVRHSTLTNELWIGSSDAGIIRKSGLIFQNYHPSNSLMPDVFVQCIHVDPQGIVWAGTQIGGLVRIDPVLLTSINEPMHTSYIAVFPNPATDWIHIKNTADGPGVVSVIDMQGRVVARQAFESNSESMNIRVAELPIGNYHVVVSYFSGPTNRAIFVKSH